MRRPKFHRSPPKVCSESWPKTLTQPEQDSDEFSFSTKDPRLFPDLIDLVGRCQRHYREPEMSSIPLHPLTCPQGRPCSPDRSSVSVNLEINRFSGSSKLARIQSMLPRSEDGNACAGVARHFEFDTVPPRCPRLCAVWSSGATLPQAASDRRPQESLLCHLANHLHAIESRRESSHVLQGVLYDQDRARRLPQRLLRSLPLGGGPSRPERRAPVVGGL